MTYKYTDERDRIFTEDGQVMFLEIRDNVKRLLKEAGAFRTLEALSNVAGDSFMMMACFDRLVEIGEIRELTTPSVMGQYRVFVAST